MNGGPPDLSSHISLISQSVDGNVSDHHPQIGFQGEPESACGGREKCEISERRVPPGPFSDPRREISEKRSTYIRAGESVSGACEKSEISEKRVSTVLPSSTLLASAHHRLQEAVDEVSALWDGLSVRGENPPWLDANLEERLDSEITARFRAKVLEGALEAVEAWRRAWMALLAPQSSRASVGHQPAVEVLR